MRPNEKYVINISMEMQRLQRVAGQHPTFKVSHENNSITGGHPSTHGSSACLEIVLPIKFKMIMSENKFDNGREVTNERLREAVQRENFLTG